jgi:AraC-like DNA-binding protein
LNIFAAVTEGKWEALPANWVFIDDDAFVPQADQASHRVVLDGPATGQLVSESVRKGVGLFAAEVRAEPGFRLTTDQRVTPGTLHIGCVISGQGTFASPGKQQDPQHWRGAGTIMTMVPADDRLVYHVEIDQPMSGLGINVEPEALAAMFGSDELPPSLRDIFEGKITPVATVTKARFDPARIANDLLRPDFAGSLMSLYREAKSLEFLTHLLGSLESAMPAGPVDLSKRVLTKVEEARDRLVSDLRNPPGLHDLAGAVGLTAKVLNQGFRTLYGTTVFDYLRDTRLTAARRMIEDGLEMPLKQIAWQVGYGQASNFVSAYRRHFGAPPRRLNRQRSLAQ